MRGLLLVAAWAAIAPTCRGGEPTGDGATVESSQRINTDAAKKPEDAGKAPPPATKPDPCGAAALGLKDATPLALWTPPAGCSPRAPGGGNDIVRSADELQQRFGCAAADVDFTKHSLLAVTHTLSPAGAGISGFDDGKVVTLATRQRFPCGPGGPMPMPMQVTAWFLLPAGGERTFAATTCTLASDCG
jgi:hypothetical protein